MTCYQCGKKNDCSYYKAELERKKKKSDKKKKDNENEPHYNSK